MQVNKFLPTPSTDMELCKQQLSNGSRSFYFASHLLPSVMQHAACGLYAFCREADDLVDEGENPTRALELLHNRLDRIYEGKPQYVATDRVLTQIVHTYHMPRELLPALLGCRCHDVDTDGRSRRQDAGKSSGLRHSNATD